jgi:ankyrin repeat protein
VVRLLLDKGADLSAKNTDGMTSLLLATIYDRQEVIKQLKERGARY